MGSKSVLAVIAVLFLTGCFSGTAASPNLTIQNNSPESVQLEITAYRYHLGEPSELNTGGPPDFEDEISVGPNANTSIRVFEADDQYRVTVSYENESVTFNTKPICGEAATQVTVTSNGTLTYRVVPCEGLTVTGRS